MAENLPNPNKAFKSTPTENKLFFGILKAAAVVAVVVVLGMVGWNYIQNRHFRLSSTSPKTSQVGVFTPFIDAHFNRELGKGITATSDPSIITSLETKGKLLRINLHGPDQPLVEGSKYTITIHNISSTQGERLPDKKLVFTAKDVLVEDMPKAQRDFLAKRQANKPSSSDNIYLDNISDLQQQGLEPEQEEAFRSALYLFKKDAKITKVTSAAVALDPETAQKEGKQVYTFSMQIEDKKYQVRLECLDFAAVQVFLTDSSGKQVFDSGIVGQGGGD